MSKSDPHFVVSSIASIALSYEEAAERDEEYAERLHTQAAALEKKAADSREKVRQLRDAVVKDGLSGVVSVPRGAISAAEWDQIKDDVRKAWPSAN